MMNTFRTAYIIRAPRFEVDASRNLYIALIDVKHRDTCRKAVLDQKSPLTTIDVTKVLETEESLANFLKENKATDVLARITSAAKGKNCIYCVFTVSLSDITGKL